MSTTKPLCQLCEKINPSRMLANEVNEIAVGFIHDYNKGQDCSFCALISRAASLAWRNNSSEDSRSAIKTASQLFIQSRSPLTLKVNGRTKYPAPRLLLASDQQASSQRNNRPPLREIDRCEDRFIFAEIEHLPNSADSFIRRRDIPSSLDVSLVQKWLVDCNSHEHSKVPLSRASNTLFHGQHPFRLIDVVEECLSDRNERCEYTVLSYTWGNSDTILNAEENTKEASILVTTQTNLDTLYCPRALSSLRRDRHPDGIVPRTVRDAMELTRKIGIRYLWVDTLCIVQDDHDDKSRLVSSMGNIYNSSTLTLIAAVGDDPHAGLRGVSHRPESPIEPYEIIDHGKLLTLSLCLPSLCEEVRKGKWYTRGWTYQEQCLSQRCLYFTSNELFFQCPERQWREGYDYMEQRSSQEIQVRTGPPWWSKRLRKDPDPTPYRYLGDVKAQLQAESYLMAVQEYSQRNLKHSNDVLDAFEGIFHRFNRPKNLSNLSIHQTQAIPADIFSQAILWFPSKTCQKRVRTTQARMSVKQFSTWSWASWIGSIEFIFAESLWLSRSISHAPRKGVPIHVCIPQWQVGNSTEKTWSNSAWKSAGKYYRRNLRRFPDSFSPTQQFLGSCIGIDLPYLLDQSFAARRSTLECGQLRFVAPYLRSREFVLSAGTDQSIKLLSTSATHRGEFRFDDRMLIGPINELVMVLCTNTVTKPPRALGVFLGLTTCKGISRRVGIGFLNFSRDAKRPKPSWEYKSFTIE
ncbi:uncharacterized protein EAE97_003898 [Botrytis byssoidea]|uniref:Heterokaryon incompatibility domain-containing protein n=1 Tax=Botrytis byssoidea TaxID=139641 RepID=A0A9P5INW6_9HELO|nr:uncharacterized protein EAE97_003898 [Botrytis byssoidea]KAF7948487.1 hypothetical protein EAE97_003898 [Botrytis byssoidea]